MAKKKPTHGGARAGAGRPRTVDDPVPLSVSVDSALLEKLDRYCNHHNINRSEAVRKWLSKMREIDSDAS